MRILAFGDIHMDLGKAADIPGIGQADLLMVTGDLTNYGGAAEAATVIARLRAMNPRLLALPGNLDQPEVGAWLAAEGLSLHGQGRCLTDAVCLQGAGGSNVTPFKTPGEYSEEELTALLAAGYNAVAESVAAGAVHILVAHAPPCNTKTDRIASGFHVGSPAVRAFIEQRQPALCLTGHIHEAQGSDQIGRSLVLNPGMIKDGGYIDILVAAGKAAAKLAFV